MNYLTFNNKRNWNSLSELRREMDKVFTDFWATPFNPRELKEMETPWNPACEVEDAENHYLISIEMPGVSKDQVKIEFYDNQLLISGERRKETEKKETGTGQWYSERQFGKFQRSFTLPPGTDADKVEANYQDGILRIYIPKAEASKPRQIKVTSGSTTGFFSKLLSSEQTKSDKVA